MKFAKKILVSMLALTILLSAANITNLTRTNEVQAATYKYSDWEYHSTITYNATAKKVTVTAIAVAIAQFGPTSIKGKVSKIAAAAAASYYALNSPNIYVKAVTHNKWVTNTGKTLKPKVAERVTFYFYSDKARKNLIAKHPVYTYTSWWQ